jgi:hypothetical protein
MRRSVASWASSCAPPGSLPAAVEAARARPNVPCSSNSSAVACAASAGVGHGPSADLQCRGTSAQPACATAHVSKTQAQDLNGDVVRKLRGIWHTCLWLSVQSGRLQVPLLLQQHQQPCLHRLIRPRCL